MAGAGWEAGAGPGGAWGVGAEDRQPPVRSGDAGEGWRDGGGRGRGGEEGGARCRVGGVGEGWWPVTLGAHSEKWVPGWCRRSGQVRPRLGFGTSDLRGEGPPNRLEGKGKEREPSGVWRWKTAVSGV